ncbi:M15 family metallopeptidase [Demequina capsici]|uniref:M15 family metallopeptidase n=1 Tax=Demequina capsici TaxID=3075620 RepID=A0AA96F856_9MICO|nr:M15 family metallopeptidase [Demequina sp. OYTSA14]WNM25024.1 M15 family metallopeptidase [Demequina sp. OYTSA14]
MPRLDHARRARHGSVVTALAVGAGVAMGAAVAVGAGERQADPSSDAVRKVEPAVEAEASGSPVPAVTAQDAPLPLASTLPVADVDLVQPSGDDVFSLAAWSTSEPVSPWVVVDKARPLDPIDYAPTDLVAVDGVPGGATELLRREAASALEAMRVAAVADGAGFSIASAYRSHTEQISLHAAYVSRWGASSAESFSARAGYSEHQTGWAVDVYAGASCRVEQCFADEAAGRWVAEHGWEHGWIVRYPQGSSDVTGYRYEPWHLRYVGVALATWMHEHEVATLEEAFGLGDAPDYLD